MSTATVTSAIRGANRPTSFSKRLNSQWWRHLLGIVAVVFAAFPLVYVLSASLAPGGTLTGSNKLFSQIDFSNYSRLLSDPVRPYGQWYLNTLVIAAVTAALTVFLGALASYSFSRMRFKGRRGGLLSLMLIQMFPQLLTVVAIFLLLTWLGDIYPVLGVGSRMALIMVYLGGALGALSLIHI